MKRVLGNLALLAGTFLVLVCIGEFVLRGTPSRSGSVERNGRQKYRFNPFRPDGVLSYALRPGAEAVHQTDDFQVTVRTNSLALRGAPATTEKEPGVLRILVLGDSFAFGFGVEDEETFSALLDQALDERMGPVEVLNAGVPGWSADHYLLFLRNRGLALDPDLVLVATTENDPGDLFWNRLSLDGERLPLRTESTRRLIDHRGRMRYVGGAPDLAFPGRQWFADHSYLYHWLRFRITKLWISLSQQNERRRHRERAGSAPEGDIGTLAPEEIQRGLLTGAAFQLRYHRYLMAALEKECQERGIAVRTLLVTFRSDGEIRDTELTALHADCARQSPGCLDSETFFDPGEVKKAFFPSDGHWTSFGHRRVARRIADWLASNPPPTVAGGNRE